MTENDRAGEQRVRPRYAMRQIIPVSAFRLPARRHCVAQRPGRDPVSATLLGAACSFTIPEGIETQRELRGGVCCL
jgi:hypothetical protein